MSMSVDDLITEGITEVVVTTISKDGVPNAAPMGIVRHGQQMLIRMFTDTRTFKNVSETGLLVANFTADPMAYVVSAFEDLPGEYFRFEKGMAPPMLKCAAGWILFKCNVTKVVELEPLNYKVERCSAPRFNRAFAAVIEATILGTRLRFYKGDEARKKMEEYETIVKKCGGPAELEAMKKLKAILKMP